MPSEIFDPSIDYETKILNASTSIYRTISPQGANSVLLSQTSNIGPVEFIVPSSLFNPSKSKLNFSFTHQAVAGQSSWCNANLLTMINRIVIYDQSTNAQLMDCSSIHEYASLISTIGTPIDEYLTKSYSSVNPGQNATVGSAGAAIALSASSLGSVEDIQKSNTITNLTASMAGTLLDLGAENTYIGRRQRYINTIANSFGLDVSIPFSALKMSFMALDRMLYFPSNLVIQVYFNSTDTFLFQSASAVAITTPISLASASVPTISNLSVSLCNEGSLNIVGQLISTVMSKGLSIPIAYPTTTRQSIASSSNHSYVLQLTRGFGQRILAILTAPFSNVALVGSCIHGRGNLTFINDFINNVALKFPSGYDLTKSQDYKINIKETSEKSALQTIGEYANSEWLLLDSFVGDVPFCKVDQTVISGLDVSGQSSSWQVQATVNPATSYSWVTLVIGQKIMSISNQSSVVV